MTLFPVRVAAQGVARNEPTGLARQRHADVFLHAAPDRLLRADRAN